MKLSVRPHIVNEKTNILQSKIRGAIQWMQHAYQRNPWIFMTEADIQCYFYARLLQYSSKAQRVKVLDANSKKLRDSQFHVLTQALHAELSSSRRKATEYADLCLLNPSKTTFWIKKSKYNRSAKEIPVWDWDWQPKDTVGIEIKFNRWILKTKAYSHETKRTRVTKRWNDFRSSLVRDFKKLKRYQRGWLIFVDQHSLFTTRQAWRDFIDDMIRDANYGYAKKTLNAYCLCPRLKRAISYKAPHRSF